MNSNRKTAIIVGALYILGTVAGILGEIFGPNLEAPDYLANLSTNEKQVLIRALLDFTIGCSNCLYTNLFVSNLKKV
jgi:hypothetical protein